jgi:hypothetical protein
MEKGCWINESNFVGKILFNPLKRQGMIYWILFAVIYVVGIFVAYNKMQSWSHTKFEKVAFSVIWPLVAILYGIHWLHNNM